MKRTIKKRIFNDKYYPYLLDTTRYQHYYGGSNSGKSWFVAQKIVYNLLKQNYKKDILCLRKVEKTIANSSYKRIKKTIYKWKVQDLFEFYKSPLQIVYKPRGQVMYFMGLDDPEKIKSIDGIQVVWFEEFTESTRDDYLELRRRARGMSNIQFLFSYNPINENHWIKIEIHNKPQKNTLILKTTYLDNKFATPEDVEEFEYLRVTDENQWRIYALGEWGTLEQGHKFDIRQLLRIKPAEPLTIIDGVKVFKMPEANQIYSIGIDPSSGLGNDWSCISMRNFYTGEVVAQIKSKTNERETARIAVNLANWYNQSGSTTYIACEINGLGRAVQNMIQDTYDERYIYKRYIQDITKKFDVLIPDFGFQTTNKNRDLIINNFVYAFADGQIDIVNKEEIDEAKSFIWNVKKNRYEAQEGTSDDLLFSDFICFDNFNYIRQHG